jgi:hypothetical protein
VTEAGYSSDERTRLDIAWQRVNAAEARAGGVEKIPQHRADYLARSLNREAAVEAALERASVVDPRHANTVAAVREAISDRADTWAERRKAERALADYIDQVAAAHPSAAAVHELDRITEAMRACRQSGAVGIKPDGGHMIAWDSKCDLTRLCPDESNAQAKRVAERYIPAMMEDVTARGPGRRRVISAVFTCHNFHPGWLMRGKEWLFQEFRARILDAENRYCPLEYDRDGRLARTKAGHIRRSRKRCHGKQFPIRGALVVQEDPLGAAHDWNVHLNVVMIVEGPISYADLRAAWGANVEFREIDGRDAQALQNAMAEQIKYAAQAVPHKSEDKAQAEATRAPAMTEWPYERWLEWWSAQQGTRRVRSYGVLHGIPAPETLDIQDVQWIGTISYDGSTYHVALGVPEASAIGAGSITGNNFSASGSASGADPPDRGRYRPPGYH